MNIFYLPNLFTINIDKKQDIKSATAISVVNMFATDLESYFYIISLEYMLRISIPFRCGVKKNISPIKIGFIYFLENSYFNVIVCVFYYYYCSDSFNFAIYNSISS